MIKYNPKLWLTHIFNFHKSDTLIVLLPEILIIGFYTWLVCYIEINYSTNLEYFKNAMRVHTLVGFVIGLLLVFRTNTAYDRWWEGRKLWGQLVNTSRNSVIKVNNTAMELHAKELLKKYVVAFPVILKDHLRNRSNDEFDEVIFDKHEKMGHRPSFLVNRIYAILQNQLNEKKISEAEFLILDKEFVQLLEIAGACERIKNTPIPFSYSLFIKKFIFLYCFTLPIGLVPVFYYWSISISMFILYVLVSIEILAEEVEDPFGIDDNDLPMDEIANKIKSNIHQIMP